MNYSPTFDVPKAIRLFKSGKGRLRTDSLYYSDCVKAIGEASDPLGEAQRRLDRIHAERSQRLPRAIKKLVGSEPISLSTLDDVVDLVQSGFSCGYLDPQHYNLINRYKETILNGTATVASLVALAETLTAIAVYDLRKAQWTPYRD